MDKTTTLLNEGQRTTPIMQKFYDLHDAIGRYNRVTAVKAKAKIAYAYGILLFIDDAIEAIKAYQKEIKHLDCHDALALNFKEMTQISYWLKKVDRLYQEMQAYGEKTLREYKVTIGDDDKLFTNTRELYEAIEKGIEELIELLKQIEAELEAAPSELYLNFYRNLPDELNTPEAIYLLEKARQAGCLDDRYQPTISNTESALLANEIAERLKIRNKWKVFEKFWNKNNMRSYYNDALYQQKTRDFLKKLNTIFAD